MIDTEDSNLVRHAKRELALAGVEEDLRPSIIAAVSAFASYGHSGGSASVAIPMLNELLRFHVLTPLTDDPAEWMKVVDMITNGEALWQSTRQSDAFSMDGGRTYYVLREQRRWLSRIIPWRVWRRLDTATKKRVLYRMIPSEKSGVR